MKKLAIFLLVIICMQMNQSCSKRIRNGSQLPENDTAYDMRNDLKPSRLAIAMWDFSWMFMHYPGGAFEDFNKVTDELLERGFNTVRIDAFPLIIGKLDSVGQLITIPGDPLRNWGASDKDRLHAPAKELIEFMEIAGKKKINIILSSWGNGCVEFPDLLKEYQDRKVFRNAWEKTLNILRERNLLGNVAYVDLDQEFPFFSPFQSELAGLAKSLKESDTSLSGAMEDAGQNNTKYTNLRWNDAQMDFVSDLLNSTLAHFQKQFPELRFTFSLTDYWKEVRALDLHSFDVLELHFWMSSSPRFTNRTLFGQITKDRGSHDYSDYMKRINYTMESIRPMLLKDLHNMLIFGKEWSEESGAPLVTTEAWGPWWHMDHKDLDWKFLYDWCAEGMNLAEVYGLWGSTPWNYSHPYWKNWENIQWYRQLNNKFLNTE